MIDLRRRRVVLGMTAGVAAALGVSGILLATTVGADPSREPAEFARKGTLRLVPGQTLVSPFPRLDRGRFRGAPGDGARLAEGEQVASIFGSLVPVAVRSSEGSIVAFSSLRVLVELGPDEPGRSVAQGEPVGIPSVRVLETGSRRVRLLERGAHSPALSLQGRLAFFKGDADVLRGGVPYEGHVLVGDATGTRFERWTTEPARYMPYAWAGGTLLVYRALPGSEATDLYAYTGPGEARLVAPLAFVIALSPDGTRVLVSSGRRMVQIVRIDDGAIEASLALDGDGIAAPDSDTTPHMLEFSGSWRGKHVVANSDAGLVVLDVSDGIRIASVFATPAFAHGISEPRFVDDRHVVGWANLAASERAPAPQVESDWDHALVRCDLVAETCATGKAHPQRELTRWIENPSR